MWTYNQTTNSDELYHYGVLGMKWGRRKALRTHTKSIRKPQKEAARQAGKYNTASEFTDFYDRKYKKAVAKGKTKRADRFKKRIEESKNKMQEANKQYLTSRESVEKAKRIIDKNSNLIITYGRGRVYTGGTVDGGAGYVEYSKAKVRENNEKNRKKYVADKIERGYKFITTHTYYH